MSFAPENFHGLAAALWLLALVLLFFAIAAVALLISVLQTGGGTRIFRRTAFSFFLASVAISLFNYFALSIYYKFSEPASMEFKDKTDDLAPVWFVINLPLYFVSLVLFLKARSFLPESRGGRYLVSILTAIFFVIMLNILFMIGYLAGWIMILEGTPLSPVYSFSYQFYISWFYALNLILLAALAAVAKRKLFG